MAPKELIAPSSSSTTELAQSIAPEDISFRLVKDSIATEGNNFLMFADNGCFCFVNIMLVNAVLKKHQLGLTIKLYDEKFNCTTLQRTYDGKEVLKLADNKLSATFDGNQVTYDAEKRTYRLSLRDEKPAKEGPKVDGTYLDVTFTADCDSFKLGSGTIYYGKDKEDYAFLAFSMPRAKVTGKATIDGKEFTLDGHGFVTKNLSNMTPHKLANSFHHCKLITPELTLALCKIETPKSFNKAIYSWGYLVENGNLVCATTQIEAEWLDKGVLDPETKYTVPTKVLFKWAGKTKDDKDFKAEINVELKKENLLCRFDVLGHVPAVFRVFVEKLIARPYFYQYYEVLEGKITIGEETRTISGRCLHEYHFIND